MSEQLIGGRYRCDEIFIEDKIGKVFKGIDTESGMPIFVTLLDPRLNVTLGKANLSLKVSYELSNLLVPQILLNFDKGQEGENIYIVSEGCDFTLLKSLIKTSNGLQPIDVLGITYQICSALRNAAGSGINHLDLTSQNIFVNGDAGEGFRVRIARYGFSDMLPPYSLGRKNEAFYGSPDYLAPEICSGRQGDHLSDIYSVGILMYEMITGKPPFVSNNFSTTIKRQIYEKPLPPNLVKPGVKHLEEVSKIVLKAVAKEPKQRYSDITELMEVIANLKSSLFPELNLSVEQVREECVKVNYLPAEDAPTIVVDIVDYMKKKEEAAASEEEPAKKEEQPRETMVFTGLIDRIKEVEEEHAKQGKAAKEELLQDEVKTQIMQAHPVETAEKKIKPSEDWFVEDSSSLSDLEGEGEPLFGTKKDSKIFYIIMGAISLLVIIALAIYLDTRSAESVLDEAQKKPPPIATISENRVVAITPQEVTTVEEVAALTPTAEAEVAETAAVSLAEEAVINDTGATFVKEPEEVEQIKAAALEQPEMKPEPQLIEKKPEATPDETPVEKTRPKPVLKKAKPVPRSIELMPEEEKRALIQRTLSEARMEFNKKNYQKAINLSNNVLKLQPDNKLARTLLEQAKANMQ